MSPRFPFNRPLGNKSFSQHEEFMSEFNRAQRRFDVMFPLIGGIIALAFLVMIAMAALRYTGITPQRSKQRAEALALVYASNVHRDWRDPYVQCAGVDNDANGYVTCMISNRAGTTEQIECADQGITDQVNDICRPYNGYNILQPTNNNTSPSSAVQP